MSPRSKEQFEQIRADRKEAIMDAALHIFAEEGYHSASISKIAKRAKISKGLMYNYFESKHELLTTLLDELFEKISDTMQLNSAEALTDDRMISYVEKTFEIVGSDRPLWKLYFSMIAQSEVMEEAKLKAMQKVGPFLQNMLLYFQNKGCEDPMVMMRYFMATLDGAKMQYLFDEENFPMEEVKARIIQQFITD
ncbi:MAG: TetR/AcrR family transcriptional regulator [Crocinitomicaceae bacterium]|nr:TetR/AcrR family transcriptional regulator [Crocinitomicaceae bacterium]